MDENDSDPAEYGMYFRDRSAETTGATRPREPAYRNLEITDVQTTVVGGNYEWVLVRVYTDAGVVGTGEAYFGGGVADAIERMTPLLVGENPLDVDRLYEHLIQRRAGEGSLAGTTVTAISGLEIALHDLAGRVYDLPAYALLGGKYRDRVRIYCDTHAGAHASTATEDRPDPAEIYSPEAYARAAEAVLAEGFDALKFDLDVPTGFEKDRSNRHLRTPEIDHTVDVVGAVADVVGDDADVAYDCHWIYSAESAVRLARAIEPYDVWWLEDPVPPENVDVLRSVTHATATTIASGENRYRKHGFLELVTEEAVDVVQPDVPKVGGMRESRKIADLADAFYVPVALHNVSSPVGTVAGAHVAAAIGNFLALEYHARSIPWWDDLVEEDLIEEGYLEVPEAPGLGVTLDMDAVEEHMVEGETLFD